MTTKLIPFSWTPASWGLKGKSYDRAEAEYTLTGYELAIRLLEIDQDTMPEDAFKKSIWEVDLKYGKITQDVYHRNLLTLIKDDKQKDIATAELDFRHGKMTEIEYAKKIATIKNEPWVTVLGMDFGGSGALEGSFELDWNEAFVEHLKAEGYAGHTGDAVVNQWFMTVCKNIALEEFDGTGTFNADADANLEAVKRWNEDAKTLGEGRKGYQ